MLKNYFKIALRNLQRNKVYSLINIAGLSLGLACAMLIILYVKDEVSYDRFHHNINHIYRIVSTNYFQGQEHKDGVTGYLQGPRFTQNVPGIETFVRIQQGTEDIKTGTEVKSQDLLYTDSSFFNVFTFPLIQGNPKTCLKEPHSVVISEKEAKKRFGTTDALGKIILIKTDSTFTPYSVSAVAKNTPQNSSIQFDMLLPLKESEADAGNKENWFNFFLNTFVVLSPNATIASVEKSMQQYFEKDASQVFNEMKKKFGLDEKMKMGSYHLQSFEDIHMSTDLPAQNGLQNGSNPVYSYILSGIALFVLLIACINFVNLTVARSVKRAKEIGIRKVVGSSRKQLIFQFLGESFLLCFIAFVMAVLLVKLILPVFNELSNKALSISYLFDAKLILVYITLFFLTSFLAGFYPALILSSYQPTATLYGRFSLSGKNYLQKSLVVLQFALASFLITATFVIYSQFRFLTNAKLGYDDSNIVEVSKYIASHEEAATFKQELLKNPDIMDVAPKNGGHWGTMAKIDNDSSIEFTYETVDESYIPMMKIQLLQGRNFLKDHPSDSTTSVIINEAFAKKAGWKDPIGKTVNFIFNKESYQVIGVVKDYHYEPLNHKIDPQLFTMKYSNNYGLYDIKIRPGTAASSLKFIHQKFKDLYPMSPYSYVFKDEQNRKNYEAEAKWKQIIMFAAILTIFISCIGLFGLSVLSAEKRTKEIGIRKVLGASVSSVVTTLSKDFLKLVIIAMIIAIPAAWLVAGKWLENYPYRISLSWWIFASAAILVILIALATVSFQAIKAAVANPAESLRTE
jgi:putative ABC transport system permease protein